MDFRSVPLGRVLVLAALAVAFVGATWDSTASTRQAHGQSCVQPPAGLVSWWPGDTDASDIQDANDGLLTNGASAGVTGKVDGAFGFDGQNDFASIAHNANLDVPRTLALWFKGPAGQVSLATLIDKSHSGFAAITTGYTLLRFPSGVSLTGAERLSVEGEVVFAIAMGDTYSHIGTKVDVFDDTFHHLAVTWNETNTLTMYLDGAVTEEDVGFSGPVGVNGDPLFFGKAFNFNGRQFQGVMDEVQLFSRALSAPEIQAIFNAGSAGKCTSPTPPAVGGIALDDDIGLRSLETPGSSSSIGAVEWVIAVAAGVIAVGGAGWHVRKRLVG